MPGFYFAYVADAATAFDPVAHAVEDEAITELSISQSEGDFASLQITVVNPGEGLLAPGRLQWCWLSWDDGTEIVPLFHGRLAGVPEAIDGEAVRLLWAARPPDYENIKLAYAETLKVLPYYDRVWITGDTENADTVLSTYGAVWHIDRGSLELSTSDELVGEDGTLSFGEADHIYDALSLSYSGKPLSRVDVDGTLAWKQTGAGQIDLTQRVYQAFKAHKTIYTAAPRSGIVSSLTGDGLIRDWPKAGTDFGGGWSVGQDTGAFEVSSRVYQKYAFEVFYTVLGPVPPEEGSDELLTSTLADTMTFEIANPWFSVYQLYKIEFPVWPVQQFTVMDWAADRGRSEIVRFSLPADIQPLLAEPDLAENIGKISISASDTVSEPDDAGNPPVGDVRRASYLNTDRGSQSFEYLLLLARAELRRSARAVEVSCKVPWRLGVGVTLRHNAQIVDYRLPGGGAVGKITSYTMQANGNGEHSVELTIGCAIGHGGTVSGQPGEPTWVDDGYVADGYQIADGAQLVAPTGDVAYQALTDFPISDDGLSLFTLDENSATVTVTGGLNEQIELVTSAADPPEALKTMPSRICVQFPPVAGMDFETVFTPAVEPLPIPTMIDLEAAA